MKKQFRFLVLIILLFFFNISTYHPITNVTADEEIPFENIRPGWDVLTIFEIEHPPSASCIGENGDFYYIDNLNHYLMKMDEFDIHTEVISTGSLSFSDIEYQPNNNRILGITTTGFYIITSSEVLLLENYTYFQPLSELAVNPTNDSFYCGSLFDNTNIFLFDANGNNLSTVITNVQGVSQIVLNNDQSLLYYTETYLGSFSSYNFSSLETKIVRSGIGLPGTQEVIGIGVDDSNYIYSMTADGNDRGFYKYENGTYELLMSSKAGMSSLTWSPNLLVFLAAGSAGGCLITYNPLKSEPKIITPTVNSIAIIETIDGKIIGAFDNELYQFNQSGSTLFGKTPSNHSINNLIVDSNNDIYASLTNDSTSILKVNHDGTMVNWFCNVIQEPTKDILYDEKNYDIVLLTENVGQNESNVYRIPIDDPMTYFKVTTFENTTRTKGALDSFGNIFVYEAYNNTLFKIPDGSIEREFITNNFVNFTDIYGEGAVIEPPLCFCSVENGIIIGRNDDLHIWLLNENIRTTFAINTRGIDNSAIFQNINQEILCTQSTLILKLIYQEPPQNTTTPTPSSTNASSFHIIYPLIVSIGIAIYLRKKRSISN